MLRALILSFLVALPAHADPPPAISCSEGLAGPRHCIRSDRFAEDVCAQIAAEAALNDLPPAFLARLLWQESRFDPNAVSPARAMGIAQFIASTADLRGLADPFDPADAIEKSAAYLAEMTRRYGNVGLAAIGYNGGERRAERWIAGTGGLPRETLDYVRIVTGVSARTWRDDPPAGETFALDEDRPFAESCTAMARTRRVTPLVPPPPRLSDWGVQVGYGTDEASARTAYDRLAGACRQAAPVSRLEFAPLPRRGRPLPLVAARIGADSGVEAQRICQAISAAGCLCRAYRN